MATVYKIKVIHKVIIIWSVATKQISDKEAEFVYQSHNQIFIIYLHDNIINMPQGLLWLLNVIS